MFLSLICIDMCTTAINNYMDFKKAKKKHGYGYESHNAIVNYNLKESSVQYVIFSLLALAVIFGITLYLNTNILVLILGGISFAVGILYTFGPLPISRTPFGELFSGGFMGIMIPFISIYIHIFDRGILELSLHGGILSFSMNITEAVLIILISLPAAVCIANIMLANNICDIEDDIENKRYTLPVYIGKSKALVLFKILYYAGYGALVIMLIIKAVPMICVLVLATLFIVEKNIRHFYEIQTKKDTFILSVKNFVIINGALAAALATGIFIEKVFSN